MVYLHSNSCDLCFTENCGTDLQTSLTMLISQQGQSCTFTLYCAFIQGLGAVWGPWGHQYVHNGNEEFLSVIISVTAFEEKSLQVTKPR